MRPYVWSGKRSLQTIGDDPRYGKRNGSRRWSWHEGAGSARQEGRAEARAGLLEYQEKREQAATELTRVWGEDWARGNDLQCIGRMFRGKVCEVFEYPLRQVISQRHAYGDKLGDDLWGSYEEARLEVEARDDWDLTLMELQEEW